MVYRYVMKYILCYTKLVHDFNFIIELQLLEYRDSLFFFYQTEDNNIFCYTFHIASK